MANEPISGPLQPSTHYRGNFMSFSCYRCICFPPSDRNPPLKHEAFSVIPMNENNKVNFTTCRVNVKLKIIFKTC